jgi:hypothetical protein
MFVQRMNNKMIKENLDFHTDIVYSDEIKEQVEYLMKNRDAFDSYVYTSVDEILNTNKSVQIECKKKVDYILNPNIKSKLNGILFRQINTPNYETRRFHQICEGYGIKPFFVQYKEDKFTSNNSLKRSYGKIPCVVGTDKNGQYIINYVNVIDFNQSNGKKISDIKTLQGENLVELHNKLLLDQIPSIHESSLVEASRWFKNNGDCAGKYYLNLLLNFQTDTFLFDNFSLNGEEEVFTRNVFLPTLIHIRNTYGIKPIIIALEPTEIENNLFWIAQTPEVYSIIKKYND